MIISRNNERAFLSGCDSPRPFAARQAGAEIRTASPVAKLTIKDGAATSVVLKSGEEITAKAVISSADPKRTLLGLVEPLHLEPEFLQKLQNYRCVGTVAKVNLALDGLPEFSALRKSGMDGDALRGRIHIGPEIDYLERAFDHVKYGEFSSRPYLDVQIPTLSDPSLAPAGKHVMSVHMQFAPYKFFTMRPLLDWARYRTPIRNLYLCGSGTHPGTGLTGASGANAARAILKDLKR